MNKLPVSVIILTFNETNNIKGCLESCADYFTDIFVVDSYSSDDTLKIVGKYTKNIYNNEFKNYSQQRNWAINNLPIKTDWIFNLDADHRVSKELKCELFDVFSNRTLTNINGISNK